jgi:hypothetical protein
VVQSLVFLATALFAADSGQVGLFVSSCFITESLAADRPVRRPTATPAESLKVVKDFRVELLYSVPKDTEGSWVTCASIHGDA